MVSVGLTLARQLLFGLALVVGARSCSLLRTYHGLGLIYQHLEGVPLGLHWRNIAIPPLSLADGTIVLVSLAFRQGFCCHCAQQRTCA